MKKIFIALGIAIGLIALRATANKPKSLNVIFGVGDSLTAYCKYLKPFFPQSNIMCADLPGLGTQDIYASLTQSNLKGDVFIILAGVNDIASGRSTQEAITYLNKIYEYVKNQNAYLVAVLLTPWAHHARYDAVKTNEINHFILNSRLPNKVVQTYSLGYTGNILAEPFDSGDGLHLNAKGQEALANLIKDKLK